MPVGLAEYAEYWETAPDNRIADTNVVIEAHLAARETITVDTALFGD